MPPTDEGKGTENGPVYGRVAAASAGDGPASRCRCCWWCCRCLGEAGFSKPATDSLSRAEVVVVMGKAGFSKLATDSP
jgi:hypothetical protein